MPEMTGMGGMPRVVFSVHDLLTRWDVSAFPLLVVVLLIAAGAWYLRADWALAARGRRWKTRRTLSFFAGLITIDLALQSPIATMTGTYFQAHIVQHLLLMAIAPPLLAMGAPSTLYLQTTTRRHKERWLAVLRSRPFAVLTQPVLVAFLYYGVMFIFFLSSLINLAMNHMWLMDVINVFFLFGGMLFWWPMVGIDPIIHWKLGFGARMFFVLIGSAIDAFLGVAILNLSHPIASMYTLASSHAGGGLLWSGTDVLALVAFAPIYFQWMRSEERSAKRLDLRFDTRGTMDAAHSDGQPGLASGESAGNPKVSAWEAAWRERVGSSPAFHYKPTDLDDLLAIPAYVPNGNGNGHAPASTNGNGHAPASTNGNGHAPASTNGNGHRRYWSRREQS
jgi:cytochrome c oxidase assembly factor CtaG